MADNIAQDDVSLECVVQGENFPSVQMQGKRRRNRRRNRNRKIRESGQDSEGDCVAGIETLTLDDKVSSHDPPKSLVVNNAEIVPGPSKKKKTRTRKKKNSQPISLNDVIDSNQAIPGMVFINSVNKTFLENQKPLEGFPSPIENGRSHSPALLAETCSGFEALPSQNGIYLQSNAGNVHNEGVLKGFLQCLEQRQATNQQMMKPKLDRKDDIKKKKAKEKEKLIVEENKFEVHYPRDFVENGLKESGQIVKGILRINQRNYREAYINNPEGGRDIIIEGVKLRNRGLEGDEVAVEILPLDEWRPYDCSNEDSLRISYGSLQKTGKVVHILNPIHQRQAVGFLKKMPDGNSRNALFSPRDPRIPRMRIPLKECPKNMADWEKQLFCARIIDWDDVRFAKGRIVGESIGIQGDIESETLAIMLENELDPKPYDKKLHAFFPSPPYCITAKDLDGRADLRNNCIFTIDPETAKDLDDAVSCEKLENGNFKIGVHISDVSYFLSEGTPLDKAVSKRATTTYLVQKVYHMLPRELTMMCSLLPGEDKLAFSVFWEITPDATVLSHYFTRSIINSCAQLSYEHAQVMIDNPDHEWRDGELPKIFGNWNANDLKNVVCNLQKLAVIMRQRRFDGGALRVDQTKLNFRLDDSGLPANVAAYVNKESHRLIEEFMLLANMTVATALQKRFPKTAFLRCHDEPQEDMMKRLAEMLEKFAVFIDVSSAGALQKSLHHYNSKKDRNAEARFIALNVLCAKPMARARYFGAGNIEDLQFMRHYALNVPLYTHFTSPIRRYADVMVHRLLSALLGYSEEPNWTLDSVNLIASVCNKQKYSAKKAGEQSSELYFALWVGQHESLEGDAVVIDVKDRSFDAVMCSFGTVVRVYTDKLSADVQATTTPVPILKIMWPHRLVHQHISLFSVVRLALRKSVVNVLKIEATLLPPSVEYDTTFFLPSPV